MKTMQPTSASEEYIPATMPAVYLPPYSKRRRRPSELVYQVDVPTARPTNTQYLIKVHFTALCRGELEWPRLLGCLDSGTVIGHDICGTVLSTPVIDEHVREGPKFKVGDQVFGFIEQARDGGAADCVTVEEDELAFKPQNLSAAEACSIPSSALIAYQGLYLQLKIEEWLNSYGKKSEEPLRVLVLNGMDGIGIQVVQMLRSKSLFPGAQIWVCAATDSPNNESFLRNELHVDEVLPLSAAIDLVWVWTERRFTPVHLALDCGGSERFHQLSNTAILCKGGMSLSMVESDGETSNNNIFFGPLWVDPNEEQLAIISKLAERGELKPYVNKIFELHEAVDAMKYVESHKERGKVLLRVNYD
ncbi:hypothetical protein LOZ58_003130 [Ophidiomyces ophidiicola]|nr:hypothetical protein LOZ58_003130 [Ophidiomyces ophidiicola]